MILATTRTVRKADFYLNEEIKPVRADIFRYFYWASPVPDCRVKVLRTAVTDLGREVDALFAGVEKETRRQIRLAEKGDALRYEEWDGSPEALDMICDAQDRFASFKGLPASDRRFLRSAARAGLLEASWVRGPDGEPCAWRVYYKAKPRVRPIRGGSRYYVKSTASERQLVGRATRYLLWRDMMRFREAGFTWYDQGGWYAGSDPALLKVNQFKGKFGVRVVEQYDCVRAATWKGRLALWYLDRTNGAHTPEQPPECSAQET